METQEQIYSHNHFIDVETNTPNNFQPYDTIVPPGHEDDDPEDGDTYEDADDLDLDEEDSLPNEPDGDELEDDDLDDLEDDDLDDDDFL